MPQSNGLSVVIESSKPRWEEILRGAIAPLAREIRDHRQLESFFFGRFNKPSWQLCVCLTGRKDWLERSARPLIERHLTPFGEAGAFSVCSFGAYEPELERYGGEEGMLLTEQIYHHDTLACLDLMEAEARGEVSRSRREYSLLMVERLLDLMRFDRERRIAFYERGYGWALNLGTWDTEEIRVLQARYEGLRPALLDLLRGEASRSAERQWGGEAPARIAGRWLDATAPLIDAALQAHADGRISQDLVGLASSWAGMHDNRLGVLNVSEAILRFFMHRLHADDETGPS